MSTEPLVTRTSMVCAVAGEVRLETDGPVGSRAAGVEEDPE